ncbi:hypothetical protein Bbelb_169270 [Branchiostoma belcheri]|nr:hypothetical protein Bbelb_169270 [Branchiostoma belcheri]
MPGPNFHRMVQMSSCEDARIQLQKKARAQNESAPLPRRDNRRGCGDRANTWAAQVNFPCLMDRDLHSAGVEEHFTPAVRLCTAYRDFGPTNFTLTLQAEPYVECNACRRGLSAVLDRVSLGTRARITAQRRRSVLVRAPAVSVGAKRSRERGVSDPRAPPLPGRLALCPSRFLARPVLSEDTRVSITLLSKLMLGAVYGDLPRECVTRRICRS